MIALRYGHQMDFACAAGALGYAGEGYWWEKPLRKAGLVRPTEITVITKTLTLAPRKGNLRWWCPWRCVRPLGGGSYVNAVGLTNPGFFAWLDYWPKWAKKMGHKLVVSIAPEDPEQAMTMMDLLATEEAVVGVQLNSSCPNVAQKSAEEKIGWLVRVLAGVLGPRKTSGLPVFLKLGYTDPLEKLIGLLDEFVDGYEVINTVPWPTYAGTAPSPLARYGLVGGVSGPAIVIEARRALALARSLTSLPIISGGGVSNLSEIRLRHDLGAQAITIGSLFLHRPWQVRGLVAAAREDAKLRGSR